MPAMSAPRKLAAILAADVAGYSRLTGLDEEGTLERLRNLRRELINPTISLHRGRVVKTTGDGILIEFPSVVDALRCALDVQRGMNRQNADVTTEKRIEFRVGINVGDVVVEGEDLLGDSVNVAARLEGIAEPGGICISESAYQQVRDKVDVTFQDAGEQQLKNIPRPVRAYQVRPSGAAASSRPTLPLPDKPSIAVLPFKNMSGDPEQEHFSDGIAEDIIMMLSHSRSLFVIARNSSFTYKGRAVDAKQVSCELGVRYLLEGSVRRGGNRVRVSALLIAAETGTHFWAERYDRDVADVFAVQDEITEAVATAIEPTVAEMERQRAVRRQPESLGAWEAYQRGLWHISQMSAADYEKAKQLLRRAIDLDPNFGAVYSVLALATTSEATLYQTRSMGEAAREATAYAQRAISLDPMDALGHCCMGIALLLQGDCEGGLAEARRALAINPNLSHGYACLGSVLVFSGHPREAIDALRRGLRQDPYDPFRFIRLALIG